jgi:hypothetical protein
MRILRAWSMDTSFLLSRESGGSTGSVPGLPNSGPISKDFLEISMSYGRFEALLYKSKSRHITAEARCRGGLSVPGAERCEGSALACLPREAPTIILLVFSW